MFELRAKARRLFAKTPPALIIVDYLQLMAGDSRAESRQQEVANISRSLKQLARELEVPIIAVSQLNRAPETQRQRRAPPLAPARVGRHRAGRRPRAVPLRRPERPVRPRASSSSRSPRTGTVAWAPCASPSTASTRGSCRSASARTTTSATTDPPPCSMPPILTRLSTPSLDPVSLLRALGLEGRAPVVLLDSAGGSAALARRHYLAWDPVVRLRARAGVVTVRGRAGGGVERRGARPRREARPSSRHRRPSRHCAAHAAGRAAGRRRVGASPAGEAAGRAAALRGPATSPTCPRPRPRSG